MSSGSGDGFVVTPADGSPVRTRAIVLAHGLRYDPPALPGIDALWGRSVFHCAFCDGWEVRDRPLAFRGSGPGAARSALVLAGWSNDVVLCTDGAPDPGGAVLEAAGVRVRTEPIAWLAGNDGRLERDRVHARPGGAARGAVRRGPGATSRTPSPPRSAASSTEAGTIVTDADGRTNVAAVYAAGDAATAAFAVGGQCDRHGVTRRVRGGARARRDRCGPRRGRLTTPACSYSSIRSPVLRPRAGVGSAERAEPWAARRRRHRVPDGRNHS